MKPPMNAGRCRWGIVARLRRGTAMAVAVWLLACCSAFLLMDQARAEVVNPGEYEVKAAFLFNFIKFIDWPVPLGPKDSSPYVIGLAGNSPSAETMAAVLKGKSIGSHAIDVRLLGDKAGTGVLRECHVVFLFGQDHAAVDAKLAVVRGASVLTVGEMPGFAGAGGMIGFKIMDDNMRFEINNSAARDAGLTISSKLLKLATLVITKP